MEIPSTEPDTVTEPREYRMAREYRRVIWILASTFFILPVLLIPIIRFISENNASFRLTWILALFIPGILLIQYSRTWRLRIDNKGIYQRWLCFKRRWPWKDFENGHVRLLPDARTFLNSRKPAWKRCFSFSLEDDEVLELVAQCMRYWKEPEAELTDTGGLVIHPKITGRRHRVEFSERGIEIRGKKQMRSYNWHEIERISFHVPYRMQQCCAPVRIEFSDFSFDLPGEERDIDLNVTKCSDRVTPLMIYAFLMNHVSEDKIDRRPDLFYQEILTDLEARMKYAHYTSWLGIAAIFSAFFFIFRDVDPGELSIMPLSLAFVYVLAVFTGLSIFPIAAIALFMYPSYLKRQIRETEIAWQRQKTCTDMPAPEND